MKQSGAVVVGIVGVGALLYLRSRRTTPAASGALLVADDSLTVNTSPAGRRLPPWRGFASTPWDKTSADGTTTTSPDSGGGDSSDAGASVFAGLGTSVGTQAGDTGASLTLGGGRGSGGSTGGGTTTGGAHIGTAASGTKQTAPIFNQPSHGTAF